ncbi:prion-like-(Q/N-rich) domain-bearing protein 25 [Microplitis demolitor]|uniref:prion-like-(Q/N-rich) domain-bearing protein 25 n=1 Tax=Microplitis demolitor TaxID=69319 RepID=UPI0004CD66E7|nr:prion-like-(Q/N-rich) domain-bearing protein 25 [Microplitis demolitor]
MSNSEKWTIIFGVYLTTFIYLCQSASTTVFGDKCNKTIGCENLRGSHCLHDKCVCEKGYFEENGKCIAFIGTECKNNDCLINFSSCIDHTCQCHHTHVNLHDKQCLERLSYGDSCEHDIQCTCTNNDNCILNETYVDLICQDKFCSCPEGYHYAPNKNACIKSAKELNDACETNDNCLTVPNSRCIDKQCTCPDNNFVNNNECLLGIGASCSLGSECSANNSYCSIINGCSCQKNYVELSVKQCVPTKALYESCEINEQCSCEHETNCYLGGTNKDLLCLNNKCDCPADYHYDPERYSCVPTSKGLGDNCLNNADCSLINTECINGQCSCKQYYYKVGEYCLPGIGAPCSDNECRANNSMCATNRHCICHPRHIFASIDRCIPVRSYGELCEQDEQCSCLFNKCRLDESYKDIVCWDGKCGCPADFHYAFRRTACVHSAKGIGDQCDNDDNCMPLLNTKCIDNKCQCIKNYFPYGSQCKQGLDAFCISNNDCSAIENGRCVDHKCQCKENYVKKSTGRCVAVSLFGKQCEYDIQCHAHTENAVCISSATGGAGSSEGKICQCSDGQHHHGSGCHVTKKLGDECDHVSQCFVTSHYASVDCRSQCTCAEGFTQLNETYCGGAGSVVASLLLITLMFVFKFFM